jgi:hypothetical protein
MAFQIQVMLSLEKNDHRDKMKFEQSTIDPSIYWKFKYAENATDVPNVWGGGGGEGERDS